MSALKITNQNFEKEVIQSEKPVLIDFFAEWCGPCKMLSPIIEQIASEVDDVKICKINVDESPEIAKQFSVMSIPTLVMIKDGRVVETSVGAKPKQAVLDMIQEYK